MSDILLEVENTTRLTRPSLAQVMVVIEFMKKHPELANNGRGRNGISNQKFKKLWIELSNILNSVEGAVKSTRGWIKFWSDKRRSIKMKQKQIEEGKSQDGLSSLEQQILDLCHDDTSIKTRKRKTLKQEAFNGDYDDDDDDSLIDLFCKDDDANSMEFNNANNVFSTEAEGRHINMMEKIVQIMGQQATAMSNMAEASLNNSKAMEQLAQASHLQAQAVDRLAGTFETITSSVHDVRNAMISIDYTMKRCFNTTTSQHRQDPNIFS